MKPPSMVLASLLLVLAYGCSVKRTDYRAYLDNFPKSVLVLPPINESLEVQASGMFLSTITMLLAERGYYVFPVAVAAAVNLPAAYFAAGQDLRIDGRGVIAAAVTVDLGRAAEVGQNRHERFLQRTTLFEVG